MADKEIQGLNQITTLADADKFIVSQATDESEAKYIEKEDALDGFATDADLDLKADKANVLELDNTDAFTPDADYEPATKKYVDDATPTLGTDDVTNDSSVTGTTASNALETLDADKADKTNVLELDNTTTFTPDADYEPATKKYSDDATTGKADKSNVLELDNTDVFVPDADYEPATKKYVDDATPALALDDLSDVEAASPTDNYALTWDETAGDWIPKAVTATALGSLDDVDDVNVPSPEDGDSLIWDDAASEWISEPAGGSANVFVFDEEPTETPNGTITNFSTEYQYAEGKIEVFKNGVRMTETDDYTEDTDKEGVTFVTAPATGTKIRINYLRTELLAIGDSGSVFAETPSGLINGTNTAYDTANEYIGGSIRVYLNGQLQTLTTDYAETDSDTITFVTAPETGDVLRVYYERFLPSAGNASLLDGNTVDDLLGILYPVGSIYISGSSTMPTLVDNLGTWTRLEGVVIVGASDTDTDFDNGDTGGAKTADASHVHTMGAHAHKLGIGWDNTTIYTRGATPPYGSSTGTANTGATPISTYTSRTYREATSESVDPGDTNSGGNSTQSVVQPYKAKYMWERTA